MQLINNILKEFIEMEGSPTIPSKEDTIQNGSLFMMTDTL